MHPFFAKILAYLGTHSRKSQEPVQTASPSPTVATPPSNNLSDSLQREIRAQRKFSIAEAIGREGNCFMKGESTIPRPLRATTEINQFITTHLSDPTSALSTRLQAWAQDDIRLSRQLDTPLVALAQIIESLLKTPTTFEEFSRQVAIAHSQLTGDAPYFQALNQQPHPQAHYTHTSLRIALLELLQQLPPLE